MTEQNQTNENATNVVALPAQTFTVSFHAARIGKEDELKKALKEIGANFEEYKDAKGNDRVRRKPAVVKVEDYEFTPEQTEAMANDVIRQAIRNTLQDAHFEEVDAESLKELLDAELFSSGGSGGGIKLSKDERDELAKAFEAFLTEIGVAEQGRNALVPVLKFGASDSKMKVFGDYHANPERIKKACSVIQERLKAFADSGNVEGLELAFTEAVIKRVSDYSENGPKQKEQEKDLIDNL